MGQIDRVGSFRGHIVEKSIDVTKNNYPQAVIRFNAVEMYDDETKQWLDWSKYDETEITAYLVLAGKDGNLGKNYEQLKKATGWSGESFDEFEETDYSKVLVQFRVKLDSYNGKTSLKVAWVDHADADPSNALRKMDKAELKALDAKWAKVLKTASGGAKPKAVPAGKPKPPAPPVAQAPAPEPETTVPVDPDPTPDSEAVSAPSVIATHLGLPTTCTSDEAWKQVNEHYSKTEFTPAQVEEAWLRTIEDLGGNAAVEEDHAWANVRDIVLETMSDNPSF